MQCGLLQPQLIVYRSIHEIIGFLSPSFPRCEQHPAPCCVQGTGLAMNEAYPAASSRMKKSVTSPGAFCRACCFGYMTRAAIAGELAHARQGGKKFIRVADEPERDRQHFHRILLGPAQPDGQSASPARSALTFT